MKKRGIIIAVIVLVVFSGFAVYAFSSALNPYVSFNQARETAGSVQVMGYLQEEVEYDVEGNELRFCLEDEEGTMAQIVHRGPKPNNMEHAESVVVVGTFQGDVFVAERLLVKCPSKYEDSPGEN